MNNVLVTGSSGFIAKNLLPKLSEEQYRVTKINSKSGDICDGKTWHSIPKNDTVIHLAGATYVPHSWNNPALFFKTNLLGTICALKYCKEHSAHLVFLSSYLYGNPTKLPIDENSKLYANNPYALSKKMAEEACQFFAKSHQIDVTVLRLFNVYGPDQSTNFIIPSIINQIDSNAIVKVADLEPKRDYVYIKDVVRAIVKSMKYKNKFTAINIGFGKSHSVEELINTIQDIKNTKCLVKSSGIRRKDEIMDTVADIKMAKKLLKWEPRYSLQDGLNEIINN
tara:strand:+ start:406 stop:1248 length:843 start_codon:yes stop_codon:yes gene_type:complete